MADPVRIGDALVGDPDSEQRARVRFDARLETFAAVDEQATRQVIEFAAWAAGVLAGYPALAG